jgi:hypothetical protein
MPSSRTVILSLSFAVLVCLSAEARAQLPAAATPAAVQGQTTGSAAVADDPDLDFQRLQPDFTLVNLPTTLRLARFKSAFRVTHRFTRPLAEGSFTSLLEDFLSFDSTAQIGLEYRFGLMRGTQVGLRRTNDRTIEFFTEHSLMQQGESRPVGLAVFASIDGTNNFRDSYTPALGVVVSRTLGRLGAVYVEPIWVNNSNPLPSALVDHNDTVLLGLGARLRVRRTLYVVLEGSPRVAGDSPGVTHASLGIEKVVGGHAFQINFSNGFGSSMAALARGGASNDNWYLGFNISRKFF